MLPYSRVFAKVVRPVFLFGRFVADKTNNLPVANTRLASQTLLAECGVSNLYHLYGVFVSFGWRICRVVIRRFL